MRFVVLALTVGLLPFAYGQTPSREQTASGSAAGATDLQRSIHIERYNVAATSGPARGETLYYYKCWMCHNQYTKSAPPLKDLFQRPRLLSGEPVNDGAVTNQIKNGSPRMPSFSPNLSDADLADLLSYLRSDKCCVEGENPPANPWYRASTQKWTMDLRDRSKLSGGPKGIVRATNGERPEGVGVQLIAPSGVRTTVYTSEQGRYEFPQLPAGSYTLRIARPLEYKAYLRNPVSIQGTNQLEDIVLEPISNVDLLPATPEVYGQLSGAEWLWNLSGTAQEKATFHRACGSGCHSFQQVFRNRHDERSWRLIVERMFHYGGAVLINRNQGPSGRGTPEAEELLVKWLARVRGPDSKDAPVLTFPRPRRRASRVVITEYELPRVLLSTHDVAGDSKGNIWYTSHKSSRVGSLDPRTGIVTEYQVPLTPGAMPGTHRVAVDKDDIVWWSENWAHNLLRLDPKTGKFTVMPIETRSPLNSPGFSNFALGPDGSIYESDEGHVNKFDPSSGVAKVVKQYPLAIGSTYDNTVSVDGNFWAGGSPAAGGTQAHLLDLRTGEMQIFNTGNRRTSPARGGFDPQGNAWFGGKGGLNSAPLVQIDAKARQLREYWPPVPYANFYEAMPDKNGEVWAGELHGGGFLRLNPKTDQWTEYMMPEPYAHNRRTWIDNSADPIAVWYVDYQGYIVRIQALE
jgi:streptogramin lyase/mono/diheme cytochrome c family protein